MSVRDGDVGLVLVHGGGHDARCWGPTVDALAAITDRRVLAVDLPGRGSQPRALAGLTIADCVASVRAQIDDGGLERVVLVGHSMAGMIVPGVAASLGADRVERIVHVAANVAPEGRTVLDTIPQPTRAIGRLLTRWKRPYRMPHPMARAMFCNGMTPEQTRFVLDRLGPEAGWLARETITTNPGSDRPPVTWVLTGRDRAVSPKLQRATVEQLTGDGWDVTVVELDAPHDVMVSHPHELADLLVAALDDGAPGART